MINPHVHTLSADIEAAVAETGAGSSKGPAMSDSDSAGQSSDEEDAQEERSGLQEEMEAEQTEERHGGKSAAVEWDGGEKLIWSAKWTGLAWVDAPNCNSDTSSGHGTHVGGTIAGNGDASGGRRLGWTSRRSPTPRRSKPSGWTV